MKFLIIAKAIASVLAALFLIPLIAYETNKAILSVICRSRSYRETYPHVEHDTMKIRRFLVGPLI